MKYEIAEELGLLDRVLAQAGNHLLPKRPGGSAAGDKKKTDAGERDSTDGGKKIENRKQKGLILTKPLIFDKMLRMGSMVG